MRDELRSFGLSLPLRRFAINNGFAIAARFGLHIWGAAPDPDYIRVRCSNGTVHECETAKR